MPVLPPADAHCGYCDLSTEWSNTALLRCFTGIFLSSLPWRHVHPVVQTTLGLYIQGCGAVVKRTQLKTPASEFLFYEDCSGSNSGALGFHECGSGALFFHSSGSSSGFCSFSHIHILIVLVYIKLNEKWIKQVQKIKRIHQTFLRNIIW